MHPDRRNFLKLISLASIGAATAKLTPKTEAATSSAHSKWMPEVHFFSKHLQFLDYEDMAAAAKEMGFDGLDLTVRPKGHVEPSEVEENLPKAVTAIREAGLKFRMMTTSITRAEDPHAEKTLETASGLGCEFYRLGYMKFKDGLSWKKNLDHHSAGLQSLAALNKRLDIHGAYQNHAGTNVGSYIPDLAYLFEDQDSRYLGSQYDIRHATVEGGRAWPLGLKLIRDSIRTIVIKDFRWDVRQGKMDLVNTPVGEGVVNFEKYFGALATLGIKPIVSLHTEYDMGGAGKGKRSLTIPKSKVLDMIVKDLNTFKDLWSAHYKV